MIAAVGANGVIGNGAAIPWRLPSDFAHFKRTTMGKPLIMGRKTFQSIGRPLPGRTNIVVTRQADYEAEKVLIFRSLEDALEGAKAVATRSGNDEIMIGGGGEMYAEAMPISDRLYITHVDADPAGDVHFPVIDPTVWQVVEEPEVPPDPRDTATYRVKVYERRLAPPR